MPKHYKKTPGNKTSHLPKKTSASKTAGKKTRAAPKKRS